MICGNSGKTEFNLSHGLLVVKMSLMPVVGENQMTAPSQQHFLMTSKWLHSAFLICISFVVAFRPSLYIESDTIIAYSPLTTISFIKNQIQQSRNVAHVTPRNITTRLAASDDDNNNKSTRCMHTNNMTNIGKRVVTQLHKLLWLTLTAIGNRRLVAVIRRLVPVYRDTIFYFEPPNVNGKRLVALTIDDGLSRGGAETSMVKHVVEHFGKIQCLRNLFRVFGLLSW